MLPVVWIVDAVVAAPVISIDAAVIFPVLVVFPSAEKENVAAVLIAGAPSERMKVVAEPFTAVVPICPVGLAPVAPAQEPTTSVPVAFVPMQFLLRRLRSVMSPLTSSAVAGVVVPMATLAGKE